MVILGIFDARAALASLFSTKPIETTAVPVARPFAHPYFLRATRIFAGLSLAASIAGCVVAPELPTRANPSALLEGSQTMKLFPRARASRPLRSNADMARDFLDLHFRLEGGSALPSFTRFEGPISVALTGQSAPTLARDFKEVMHRLRSEARIPISQSGAADANIIIQSVSRQQIQRTLPNAACFVAPNVRSLEEYRRKRNRPEVSWSALRNRINLTIILPNDVSPQEVRDCLHEELAQAIGPLNDLYRLPDSVFNDDNIHNVLTGFDMLMLRATYAPELKTGMSRDAVAARLPGILARLNPQGARVTNAPLSETPRSWIEATQRAIGAGTNNTSRLSYAHKAAAIARDLGWHDHRRAYSHFLLGQAEQFANPSLAFAHYETALRYLDDTELTASHHALITARIAAIDIAERNPQKALARLDPAINTARKDQNAALLATLLLLKAQALHQSGRMDAAQNLRSESLGWARYGFGPEWIVRNHMNDIAALSPSVP